DADAVALIASDLGRVMLVEDTVVEREDVTGDVACAVALVRHRVGRGVLDDVDDVAVVTVTIPAVAGSGQRDGGREGGRANEADERDDALHGCSFRGGMRVSHEPLRWVAATILRAGRVTAGRREALRGKSGHRRARTLGRPRRRKPTESGTERRPPTAKHLSGDA